MNLFCVCEEKGIQSERKGEYTIQNFTQKRKKRSILTRNNPFDFDRDLKTNENEVRERMN